MKQKTLLLFQLLLAVFAFYSVLNYTGTAKLLLPLICLTAMFVVSKIESRIAGGKTGTGSQKQDEAKAEEEKTQLKPLDCVLRSKNMLLLKDAIHSLLKDLGFEVASSPENNGVDRLCRIAGIDATFGLTVLGDVAEIRSNWDRWDLLTAFDNGKGGKKRVVLVASNSMKKQTAPNQGFKNFSLRAQEALAANGIVGMTTLTFYKICLLCQKKKVDSKTVFRLIHNHPGGVFQLEDYAKRSHKAA
ncbi:MAG: hypothetical protein JRJ12_07005 [Deltaproteobacteria bacterium]|nr:hypothetical protein [Deltaproteobacteria bacterium]MBW2071147.1 hypothetical protein [Deltaproteobacteria bacterium]